MVDRHPHGAPVLPNPRWWLTSLPVMTLAWAVILWAMVVLWT